MLKLKERTESVSHRKIETGSREIKIPDTSDTLKGMERKREPIPSFQETLAKMRDDGKKLTLGNLLEAMADSCIC